jgi:hypothetical protein
MRHRHLAGLGDLRSAALMEWPNIKPEYVSLVAGFLGTIVGAVVTLFSLWLQQRAQGRRDRARNALDAAIKEYEAAEKYAAFMSEKGHTTVTFELPYYIVLHSRLSEFLAAGKTPTKKQWISAYAEALDVSEAVVEFHRERKVTQSTQRKPKP